jgi:HNH endonuclease
MRRAVKDDVLRRDNYTCQFCGRRFEGDKLTIDHLIPIARGGLDEPTNYVACCEPCNQQKADMPLEEFAQTVNVQVEELPVYGDPVIDNESLPIELRMLRKGVFDRMRAAELQISGKSAQKKIEKTYRRDLWQTARGKALEEEFPNLPGHVRVMIPEIQAIADNEREYVLLIELAKSARTRNLIGTILTKETRVGQVVDSMKERSADPVLRKKLEQAWKRFGRETRRRNL